MKSKLILALSVFISCSGMSARPCVENIVVPLLGAAGFYTAGTWFFKETLKDWGYRFIDVKKKYYACEEGLKEESNGLLSEREIEFFSRVQAISAIPEVYWREIASTAITIALFYAGTRCLRQALR